MVQSPRVLIVEDRQEQQKLYELICARIGITAQIVSDSEEANSAIESGRFDLIVMDWQLPEVSGLDCAKMIRDKLQDKTPPIVCITAGAMPGDRESVLQAGLSDYMSKPFSIKEFASAIERWTGCKLEFKSSRNAQYQ